MTQLGKYQIIRKIGEGATSEVYLAVDGSLNREVALKLLKPALVTDASAFDRFQKEARVAAVLFHYNIATVYEIGEIEGRYFISMRYIKGKSLDQVLKEEGPQDWGEVLRMTGQLSAALDFAHQRGFLHRDIKPSNIIRGEDGNYVLTDFGLVQAMMNTGLSSHTGAMIGTPAYMAPEVWEGRATTPAADQYALACVIYEMLTGAVLFAGETPPAVMMAHFKPVEFSNAWIKEFPSNVTNSLITALSDKPEERFESIVIFFQTLSVVTGIEKTKEIVEVKSAPPTPWLVGSTRVNLIDREEFIHVPDGEFRMGIETGDEEEEPDPLLAGSSKFNPIDKAELIYIPAGEFLMGSEAGDKDEAPEHSVYLDAFWIYKYVVTNAQFAIFLKDNGNQIEDGMPWFFEGDEYVRIRLLKEGWNIGNDYANCPVVGVTWYGAQAYCEWAGGRLPTEAEWEKAARGMDGRTYPWGEEYPSCSLANYAGCAGTILKVGSFPAGFSPYGAQDMAGNVWEWVADWYDGNYYKVSPKENPKGAGCTRLKVLRGASWLSDVRHLRSSIRGRYDPNTTRKDIGFRCVHFP